MHLILEIKMNDFKKFKQNFFPEIISGWIVAFCAFFSLNFIREFVYRTDLTLMNFTSRTIGIAVLDGVDASKRTSTYIIAIVFFFLSVFIYSIVIQLVYNLIKSFKIAPPAETDDIFRVSIFGIFILFWAELSGNSTVRNLIPILSIIILILFLIIVLKAFLDDKPVFNSFLFEQDIQILSALIPFPVIFSIWVLLKKNFVFNRWSIILYILIVVLFFIVYGGVKKVGKDGFSGLSFKKALYLGSTPFLLIPFSIPISNEIQFTLSNSIHSARIVSAFVIGFLSILSIIIFIIEIKKKVLFFNALKYLGNVCFPIIIATLFLYQTYKSELMIDGFDMFHHGENLIVNQQLIQFSKIPFINIYPTHGLSSLISQILYSFINGYKPVEPWLWGWTTSILLTLLSYFIIKNLFGAKNALFITILLPLNLIVRNYYAIVGISALLISKINFVNNLPQKRLRIFWISIWSANLFIIAWRIDFGIAAILATFFLLIAFIIRNFLADILNRNEIIQPVLTGSIIFISLLIFIYLLTWVGHTSFTDFVIQNIQFIKFQAPVQAYSALYGTFSPIVFVQCFVVPAISAFYIIYFSFLIVNPAKSIKPFQITLTFIAVFSLIISIRSTQRHSLVERFNPYFMVLLLGSLFLFLGNRSWKKSILFFCAILISYLITFPDQTSYSILSKAVQSFSPSTENSGFKFKSWKNHESRAFYEDAQFADLKNYFDSNLRDDQTFLDLSNYPMLYVETQREFVTYFVPVIYNSSDPIQEIQLKNLADLYKADKIPFVILKNGTWWDNVDGVANEIRSYRLFEFVYENYHPYGYVSNYQLWLANNSSKATNSAQQDLKVISNWKISTNHLIFHDAKLINLSDEIIVDCGNNDPQVIKFSSITPTIIPAQYINHAYIKLDYRSNTTGNLQMFFQTQDNPEFSEALSSKINISRADTVHSAYFPIPGTVIDSPITGIRLDPPNLSRFTIIDMQVVLSDQKVIAVPINDIDQIIELKELPYIWGQYDDKQATDNTKVLANLIQDTGIELNEGEPHKIEMPGNIDKSSGNYIYLKIQSNHKAKISLKYGVNNDLESEFIFYVLPSDEPFNYLVRVSSEWDWMNKPNDVLIITSDNDILLEELNLRKGD